VLAWKQDRTLTLIDFTKLTILSHVVATSALLMQKTSFFVKSLAAFKRTELVAVPIIRIERFPGAG